MEDVDVALAALADPTRRQVIEMLLSKPRRTNELADAIGVSVPAVSRHLRVLRERGLVERSDVEGDGRGRMYNLKPSSLGALSKWLDGDNWSTRLPKSTSSPGVSEYLARVGGFLDGFAQSDAAFFERHLAQDVQLVFPGSAVRWDKASTVASVSGHAPYVAWNISESSVTSLGAGLTLVVITVEVRTTARSKAVPVVQSMVFDDTGEPWTLRFLQQSSAK